LLDYDYEFWNCKSRIFVPF